MTPAGDARTLGERVAFFRRRRGLSQVELGRLVGRSESWVSQVERGARRVDRMSVLRGVADALEVSLEDLQQPPAPSGEAGEVPAVGYLDDVRLALTGHPALALLLGASRPARWQAEPSVLGSKVARARELMHASRYAELGPVLAELVPVLEEAVRAAEPAARPALVRLLAEVYQTAAAFLAKLSEPEAGWVAAEAQRIEP